MSRLHHEQKSYSNPTMNHPEALTVVRQLRSVHDERSKRQNVPSYGRTFRVVFQSSHDPSVDSQLAQTIADTLALETSEMSLGLANCRIVVSNAFANALQDKSVFSNFAGGKIPVFAVVPNTVLEVLIKEKAESDTEKEEAETTDQLTILISPQSRGNGFGCNVLHDENQRIAYGGREPVLLEKTDVRAFLRNLLTLVQNGIVDNLGSPSSRSSHPGSRVAAASSRRSREILDRVFHENSRWMLTDRVFRDERILKNFPLLQKKITECKTKLQESRMLFIHGTRTAANVLARLTARLTLEEIAKNFEGGYRFLAFSDAGRARDYNLGDLDNCAFILSHLDTSRKTESGSQEVERLLREVLPELVGKLPDSENYLILTSQCRKVAQFIDFVRPNIELGEKLPSDLINANSVLLNQDECDKIESIFTTYNIEQGEQASKGEHT